jgi:hypothetical protein
MGSRLPRAELLASMLDYAHRVEPGFVQLTRRGKAIKRQPGSRNVPPSVGPLQGWSMKHLTEFVRSVVLPTLLCSCHVGSTVAQPDCPPPFNSTFIYGKTG